MLDQRNQLDRLFHALADATRRQIVERLVRGPARVSDLAQARTMSLQAIMQHLQVLEACGLVRSEKIGRVRTCSIEPPALRLVEDWISRQRTDWEHRLDRLGEEFASAPAQPDQGGPR